MRLEEFDGGWRAVGSGSEVAHVGRATLDEHDEIRFESPSRLHFATS